MYLTAQLGQHKAHATVTWEAEPDGTSGHHSPRLFGKAYSQEVTADSSGYQHGDDHPVTAEKKRQPWYTGPEKELPVTAFLGLRSVLSKNYKMKHETIKGHLHLRCVVNLSLPLSSLSANMSPSQC